jgi:Sulfatase-modifying factor enzyme 1
MVFWWRVEAGTDRVIRGGSWNNDARNVRAAYRNANHPGNRNDNLGFRCLSSRGREYAFLNRPSPSPPHEWWQSEKGRRRAISRPSSFCVSSPACRSVIGLHS